MAILTLPTKVPVGVSLSAATGSIPAITFGDTTADRVSVRIYAAGWGRFIEAIDDVAAPFTFDLNSCRGLVPGASYEIEFRPFRSGKYIGAERRFFSLRVTASGNVPGGRRRLPMGLVDATKAFDPDTACFSSLWQGSKPWLAVCVDCHVRWIREWWSIDRARTVAWSKWQEVRQFVQSGMSLVICLNWSDKILPTAAETTIAMLKVVANVPADLKPHITFEVGNEPGRGDYWPGNHLGEFVRRYLNPAYDVLHLAGYRVILGGLNGVFADDFRQIQSAGGRFDIVGIHPYSLDVASFRSKYAALLAQTDLPIWETESRAFLGSQYKSGKKSAEQWIAEDELQLEARTEIRQIERIALFGPDVRDSATGPGGLFKVQVVNGRPVRAEATVFFERWFGRRGA